MKTFNSCKSCGMDGLDSKKVYNHPSPWKPGEIRHINVRAFKTPYDMGICEECVIVFLSRAEERVPAQTQY